MKENTLSMDFSISEWEIKQKEFNPILSVHSEKQEKTDYLTLLETSQSPK